MRKIKFRGKCLDNGEWIYGDLLHTSGGKVEIHRLREEKGGDLNPWWASVAPETVGQFTGLLDKNSSEIYDGDILKNKDTQIIVKWDNYKCEWNIVEYGIYLFEIVANIHVSNCSCFFHI